jgi:hypothetical protein
MPPTKMLTHSTQTIRDIEALLIQSLGTYRVGNKQQTKFVSAERWTQIMYTEVDEVLAKLQ